MISKNAVNEILKGLVNDKFIKLWWDLSLPGLGYETPNEVWEQDPEAVLRYAKGYILDPSFV